MMQIFDNAKIKASKMKDLRKNDRTYRGLEHEQFLYTFMFVVSTTFSFIFLFSVIFIMQLFSSVFFLSSVYLAYVVIDSSIKIHRMIKEAPESVIS